MSANGYDIAFEQATNERGEVRIEIERLLTRGEMLDKLLECLSPFVSSPKSTDASSQATEHAPAAGHTEEQHAHEQHEHHEQQHEEHHEYHQG